MRGLHDDDPVDWWFASTGIPLLAATFGPLANVASIAALVTSWRQLVGEDGAQIGGQHVDDPRWCYAVNLVSLVLGFVGNLFLLLNFTHRVRYIISLPISIILWFTATGLLIGDLAAMHIYYRPNFPTEIFSGGYWYGVAAAALYLVLCAGLLGNFVGYIRGHYPQHFELTESQETLIVQTMLYFIWLAGGAGVYSKLEGWAYTDALYWTAVTVLTVGYGDLFPTSTTGRVLMVPFSFIGILILGLVISSIFKNVREMGEKNVIRQHYERVRQKTVGRTVTSSFELERRQIEDELAHSRAQAKAASRSSGRSPATLAHSRQSQDFLLHRKNTLENLSRTNSGAPSVAGSLNSQSRPASLKSRSDSFSRQVTRNTTRKQRIVLLREEKERFEAMRRIQSQSEKWKKWWRLAITFTVFGTFWCVGAVVFWCVEANTAGAMTYGESVYFSWVTLITIGYGDFSPKSVAGRCFFFIWVQFAVPAISILAQSMSSTVVDTFSQISTTFTFALVAHNNTWRNLIDNNQWLFHHFPRWLSSKLSDLAARNEDDETPSSEKSKEANSSTDAETPQDRLASGDSVVDFAKLAEQHDDDIQGKVPDASTLARQLALAIRRAARDMAMETPREYEYEEWVEFTRLIRFSAIGGPAEALREEEGEGLVEWDWLAENSPMMAEGSEAEFVLERLCESLVRYLRRNPPKTEFVERVKEQGEQALRLATSTWREDEDGNQDDIAVPASPRSRRGSFVAKILDRSGTGDLHPVEEEEH
ncbi:voltage-gated potassium channel [Microthyrium microscopicum]|uniref:Voltage-gated potassium channel n=1 Tax=Microthyrium microscopicum TaxID=703497 RepID=A0A6A6U534_9PEZI|nr:voltage-gated potassium channel [Microthyrium microscopicum]